MGEQKPKAENCLGHDIENGVGDNLSINGDDTGTVSKAPDAVTISQVL